MPNLTEYAEQLEADLANDDLRRIASGIEYIELGLDLMARGIPDVDQTEMRALIQEAYQECFHKKWRALKEISDSVEWPAQIPNFKSYDEKKKQALESGMSIFDAMMEAIKPHNAAIMGGSHAS